MTLTQTLARWAHELRLDDIPGEVQQAAASHLLDGLGTALAAGRSGAAQSATAVAAALAGPAEATILGTAMQVSAPAAALADGALLHALDFDDTHARGLVHATAAVLPAALAGGEQARASGADVLRAAVAGYETACRIAAASPHGFHARGIHATHACAVFSSALITALLTGQKPAVITDALGIAGSAAGGLLEFLNTGSSTKQLHPGTAALNGILAARLAAAGASGPASVLEGDKGLYQALSARPPDLGSIVAGLGSRWETTAIAVKPYPACQLLHASLDAAATVLDQVPAPEQVTRVVADVHPDSVAIVCEPLAAKQQPRTPYDAKFSLPWSVAALLTDGVVGVGTYTSASVARRGVAELAGRVEFRLASAGGVAADAPGRVTITLASGCEITGEVAGSRGTTAVPVTQSDVVAKFTANCGGADAAPAAAELAALVADLVSLPSLQDILELSRQVVAAAKEGGR